MARWPCDTFYDCDCADGNPFRNLSAEAPDPVTFFARGFAPTPVLINNPNPTLFRAPGCVTDCFSTVSQAEADQCAFGQSELCNLAGPPGTPPQSFGNNVTSCSVPCAMGDPFVYTIPANTFFALTQELADAIAESFCLDAAIEARQCHEPMPPMPPEPPGTPCPSLTTVTPASPVNATEGDNVAFNATYSYAGNPADLAFIWYLGNTPVFMGSTPAFTINGITMADAGQYTLGVFAPNCLPIFSSPITVNVAQGCPAESGNPAPDTLDIAATTDWETWTLANADFLPVVSSQLICNPTGLLGAEPTNGKDHPPGTYGFRYVTGYTGMVDGFCPGPTPIAFSLDIYQLVDEEVNIDNPVVCNFQGLAHECRNLPGNPPPTGNFGGGISGCASSDADAINQLQAFWAGKAFVCDPYPPDNLLDFKHSNTGGQFTVYKNDSGVPVAVPLQLQAIQLDGQIPQPRKVEIFNYAALIAQFSNPTAANDFTGQFLTRNTFNSTTCQWDAPAGGSFGGARLEYITNHPTSTNGKGWRITLYGAGMIPFYSAIKAVDATSLGIFYRDNNISPTGPPCITCVDLSDILWYPGMTPP